MCLAKIEVSIVPVTFSSWTDGDKGGRGGVKCNCCSIVLAFTRSHSSCKYDLKSNELLYETITCNFYTICAKKRLSLRQKGTRGYQTPLSSAPLWSGVMPQPRVTTVTAASKPPSYRGAEEGYGSAIFSNQRAHKVHDSEIPWLACQLLFNLE